MLVTTNITVVLAHTHKDARTRRGRELSEILSLVLAPSVLTRRKTAMPPTVVSTQEAAAIAGTRDGQDKGLCLARGRAKMHPTQVAL